MAAKSAQGPEGIVSYATVMVNLTLGRSNAAALAAAVAVAEQCGAGIRGVAACRPIEIACGDYAVPSPLYEEDRKQMARQTKAAEIEFREAVAGLRGPIDWHARTTVLPLADHLSREARGADLIVAGVAPAERALDPTRQVDACDLVMAAGRPVMLVPTAAKTPRRFERIVAAWKDTREAQRAIADALPLLAACPHVFVVQIAPLRNLRPREPKWQRFRAGLARIGFRPRPSSPCPAAPMPGRYRRSLAMPGPISSLPEPTPTGASTSGYWVA